VPKKPDIVDFIGAVKFHRKLLDERSTSKKREKK
jgi:hypothetical protein